MSEAANITIQLKEGQKSKVCQYFGVKFVNGIQVKDDCVHCVICFNNGKKTSYKDCSAITTLMYHLRTAHNVELLELSEADKRVRNLQDPKYRPTSSAEKKTLLGRRTGIWMSVDLKSAQSFASEGFLNWAVQNRVIDCKEDFPTPQTIAGSALNDVFVTVLDKINGSRPSAFGTCFQILLQLDCAPDYQGNL